MEISKSREIGVPALVIGAVLIPIGLSIWRLATGTIREWWIRSSPERSASRSAS